jgi:hypothetical protein
MRRGLDWKWIGLGVLIMVGLNLVASLLMAMIWSDTLQQPTTPGDLPPMSTAQAAIIALIGILTFVIGGYIVGARSSGRTIVEPGISAALAAILTLALSGGFSIGMAIVGGLIPFLSGLLGGWLGERRQTASA